MANTILTTAGKTWLICPVSSKTMTDVDMVRVTLPDKDAAPAQESQQVLNKTSATLKTNT